MAITAAELIWLVELDRHVRYCHIHRKRGFRSDSYTRLGKKDPTSLKMIFLVVLCNNDGSPLVGRN